MKVLLIVLLALTSCKELTRIQKIVQKVNSMKTTWTAREYDRDVLPMLGEFIGDDVNPLPKLHLDYIRNDLPENFDLREEYPECGAIKEIRDQANCGSCWAFAAAEAMSDRLCIHSQQKDQRRISTQNILTCCSSCGFGCNGGWSSAAFNYWKSTGICTGGLYGDKTTCQPYFLPPCDHHVDGSHGACPDTVDTPDCKKTCENGADYTEDLIYAQTSYSISGEQRMMQDIYENGSIAASFTVYEDFVTYKSGVYKHVEGSRLGGHAIKIIGWGVENGTKYWLIANSWNDEWGDKGLFKILRGENECGIEGNGCAGLPK